jgi:hypothetical protein
MTGLYRSESYNVQSNPAPPPASSFSLSSCLRFSITVGWFFGESGPRCRFSKPILTLNSLRLTFGIVCEKQEMTFKLLIAVECLVAVAKSLRKK